MNKKIMIVDDDPDLLVCLRTIFERADFEVLTVDSGKDCLNELQRGFKGLVLLDLMMPFMNGWDTLREIVKKGYDKNILISIITAKGLPAPNEIQGLESYIHNYILKPFDIHELLNKVKNISTKNICK